MKKLIDIPGVRKFYFRTHDTLDKYISAEINAYGVWESLETAIVIRLLNIYGIFIDLGANIGWYSCIAKNAMSPGGRIFAFEPEERNFSLLKFNLGSSDVIHLETHRVAISDKPDMLKLYLSGDNQGDHRLYNSEAGRAAVDVPVRTLDDVFGNRLTTPLLLKSDTQGSEPKIFRGGRKSIAPVLSQSTLILEFWPHGMTAAGEDVGAFIDRLSALSHNAYAIDNAAHVVRPIRWDDLRQRCRNDLAPETTNFIDLLLLPPNSKAHEAIADLIDRAP